MFAALGRFVYRRRRVIVLALVGGLRRRPRGHHARVPASSRAAASPTPPRRPSRPRRRCRSGWASARPGSRSSSRAPALDARSPAFRAQVEKPLSGVEDDRSRGLHRCPDRADDRRRGLHLARRHATFAVLSFDGTSEQVQRMIPAGAEGAQRRQGSRRTSRATRPSTRTSSRSPPTTSGPRRCTPSPVAILVLVLIFGTLVAAALPVIGGGMAVTVTLGLFWLLAQVPRHLRVRDERGHAARARRRHRLLAVHGRPLPRGALRRPHRGRGGGDDGRAAGRSIFFSGLTVVIGLLGLMVIPFMSMRSMGLGGALVVVLLACSPP